MYSVCAGAPSTWACLIWLWVVHAISRLLQPTSVSGARAFVEAHQQFIIAVHFVCTSYVRTPTLTYAQILARR